MAYDYSVYTLAKTFAEQARTAHENQEKQIANFKENYPDSELPDHLKNELFNVAFALSILCCEIVTLKDKAGIL